MFTYSYWISLQRHLDTNVFQKLEKPALWLPCWRIIPIYLLQYFTVTLSTCFKRSLIPKEGTRREHNELPGFTQPCWYWHYSCSPSEIWRFKSASRKCCKIEEEYMQEPPFLKYTQIRTLTQRNSKLGTSLNLKKKKISFSSQRKLLTWTSKLLNVLANCFRLFPLKCEITSWENSTAVQPWRMILYLSKQSQGIRKHPAKPGTSVQCESSAASLNKHWSHCI